MDANVISVLHQLTTNPQMVNQLQGFLSLISGNGDHSDVSNNRIASVKEDAPKHTQMESRCLHNVTNTLNSSGTLASSLQDVLNSSSVAPSSSVTLTQHKQPPIALVDVNAKMRNGTQYDGKTSTRPLSKSAMVPELALSDAAEKAREQEKIAVVSKQRLKEAEAQLQRLTQRIDELANVVQTQRQELHDAKERHQLEIDELKHTYEVVLRRKDEVHQESLRQAIKSRDLYAAAKAFEQGVKPGDDGGSGLRASATPVNTHATGVATCSTGARSGLKRERGDEGHVGRDGRDGHLRRGGDAPSGGNPGRPGKTSTLLIRTASRKRRTPRTPSLTHADRAAVSASRSPGPPVVAAAFTRTLPGTASVTLASPTPIPPGGARALVSKVAGRLPPAGAPTAAPLRCGTSPVAAGPTRSPSPVNPKRGSTLPRRFILTGLRDAEPERVRVAVEALGENALVLNGDLDEAPPFSTTHIVLRGTPRSVKALCGVVSGKWLVPPEYIYNSHEAGFWLDEYEEGGLRIFPPPLKCQRFLLTVEHDGIREKLAQVIEYGGGEVIRSPASRPPSAAASKQWTEKGIVIITSGDDLLRYATQTHA